MAIFGFGSTWDNREEKKETFFSESKAIIGWNKKTADDLYSLVASIKVGDIIYLKSNQPGSRTITVKGIGIVTKNLFDCLMDETVKNPKIVKNWKQLYVNVRWISKESFEIEIPKNEGRLTNIRAATMYEECLPLVQTRILEKMFECVR